MWVGVRVKIRTSRSGSKLPRSWQSSCPRGGAMSEIRRRKMIRLCRWRDRGTRRKSSCRASASIQISLWSQQWKNKIWILQKRHLYAGQEVAMNPNSATQMDRKCNKLSKLLWTYLHVQYWNIIFNLSYWSLMCSKMWLTCVLAKSRWVTNRGSQHNIISPLNVP